MCFPYSHLRKDVSFTSVFTSISCIRYEVQEEVAHNQGLLAILVLLYTDQFGTGCPGRATAFPYRGRPTNVPKLP